MTQREVHLGILIVAADLGPRSVLKIGGSVSTLLKINSLCKNNY